MEVLSALSDQKVWCLASLVVYVTVHSIPRTKQQPFHGDSFCWPAHENPPQLTLNILLLRLTSERAPKAGPHCALNFVISASTPQSWGGLSHSGLWKSSHRKPALLLSHRPVAYWDSVKVQTRGPCLVCPPNSWEDHVTSSFSVSWDEHPGKVKGFCFYPSPQLPRLRGISL
jgi:hypothetical protein